jgi:hypothetical protein
VDNFNVTCSKNNPQIHKKYKQFFDRPQTYSGYTTVGKTKGVVRRVDVDNRRESDLTSSGYIYQEEKGNVYKVNKQILLSIERHQDIPFLRKMDDPVSMRKSRMKSVAPKRRANIPRG